MWLRLAAASLRTHRQGVHLRGDRRNLRLGDNPRSLSATNHCRKGQCTMSMKRPPILTQPDEGRTIGVVGDIYRFLAVGEDTDGRYATWEATVPPGGGPPPHVHSREEESFYILEGELTLYVGEQRLAARAGTFANVPVGTLHRFCNESGKPVRLLITVTP